MELLDQIAKKFLKSFVISDADILCPCGAFCHGVNSRDAYIYREESDNSFATVLENYKVDEINDSLKKNNIPARLETNFVEEDFYTEERILESQAKARKNDVRVISKKNKDYEKKFKDQPPIAYCITARLSSIDVEYHSEEVYDVVGTTTEYYDEPIYDEVTKYRTEKYTINERRTKLIEKRERIEKTIKKTEYVPIYNSWSKKWEQRAYDSYVPQFEYKTRQIPCDYDCPVEKTREVPYREKIQTGTKRCSRQVPKYGYVTKKIPYRYCTPEITPFYVYLIPVAPCKKCLCVFCIGKLQENHEAEISIKDQWLDRLKKIPNTDCLVCLGHHANHSVCYRYDTEFQPKLIANTHSIFSGDKDVDPDVQKAYNCFLSFGYQSGNHGRKYIKVYHPKHHECGCIICLRERNNNCLVKCFTPNNYLTDAAFNDLINQIKNTYPNLFYFSIQDANTNFRPHIYAKLNN